VGPRLEFVDPLARAAEISGHASQILDDLVLLVFHWLVLITS
jgi:hypothetical protein